MFIGFANFYQHFIKNFSKIATLLTFLLKTIRLSNLISKALKADDNEVVNSGNVRANKTVVNLSKNNKFRNSIYISNIKAIKKPSFLTSNAKKTFKYLR